MPEIEITPALKGAVVPTDLLNSEGSMHFVTKRRDIDKGGLLFRVLDDDFIFSLAFKNSSLVFQRNDTISVLTMNQLSPHLDLLRVLVMWTYDRLYLSWGMKEQKVESDVSTMPVAPPPSLLRWARKQNLLPQTTYSSEEKFRERVYSSLASLQEKITSTSALSSFWDMQKERGRIVSRLPKNETHIHPVIHALLSDQMLMASIEVIPEYKSGEGNLDFMFLGNLETGEPARIAVEFKRAHSEDLYHGLEQQLPKYMTNTGAKYGAYVFIYFRGGWFNEPKQEMNDLDFSLNHRALQSANPIINKIRIFGLDVGKHKTASK